MSAKMPDSANSVVFRAGHNARVFSTLTAGNASTGARSFSRFFLTPLNRLREFISPGPCSLCAVGKSDSKRLAKIIGALPVGRQVRLDVLRKTVGGSFKAVAGDVRRLQQELKLPVEWTRRGITLAAPVQRCKRCARLGEQVCQRGLNPADDGKHLVRDRSGEERHHNQAVRRQAVAAPPFQA